MFFSRISVSITDSKTSSIFQIPRKFEILEALTSADVSARFLCPEGRFNGVN